MRSTKLGASLLGAVAMIGVASMAYGQSVGHQIKESARDTSDALIVTPNVKGAIIADKQLNNSHNLINVNTKDYIVHLKGHVYSKALRVRASSVAAHKLQEMHKPYKVSNELAIGH
jgi:osmotically-inducible protein OsmY